jgi:hypothetical protein
MPVQVDKKKIDEQTCLVFCQKMRNQEKNSGVLNKSQLKTASASI